MALAEALVSPELFTCPKQPGHLRLTEAGCARMFQRAQAIPAVDIAESALYHCRGCPKGVRRAGEPAFRSQARVLRL
jgi:hypothetical protein